MTALRPISFDDAPPADDPGDERFELAVALGWFERPENRAWAASPGFFAAARALFDDLDRGERMTLRAAAARLGMSWQAAGLLLAETAPSLLDPRIRGAIH